MNGLMANERKEWNSIRRKSKKYNIPVFRKPYNSNVEFDKDVYAQLGTGRATEIMDARIKIKKRFFGFKVGKPRF